MSRQLDLLVPGLFGPVPVHPAEVPPTPVLSRLLGCADRLPGAVAADPCRTLFHLFGYAPASDRDCPSGPYCRLADDPGATPAAYVLHADPVHLRPDRDRLVLFAGPDFAPDRAEADALVALFNQHLGTDGLRLEAPTPERWYLLTEQLPDLVTQPLANVLGRPIAGQMPQGPEARRWARYLNEIQMLFHHSAVNERREAAGIPTLNGLWLWGGGQRLPVPATAPYNRVFSPDPLALGLAHTQGIPTAPLPADLGAVLTAGDASTPTPTPLATGADLIHWSGIWEAVLAADGMAWAASLSALEQWLTGLDGRVSATGGAAPLLRLNFNLYPANGEHFRYRPHHRYRFWRQQLDLAPWLGDRGVRGPANVNQT